MPNSGTAYTASANSNISKLAAAIDPSSGGLTLTDTASAARTGVLKFVNNNLVFTSAGRTTTIYTSATWY